MRPEPGPRVFGVPPGADFPAAVARHVIARVGSRDPLALARVRIFANAARMRDRLRAAFAEGGATLLPRIGLVADIGKEAVLPGLPPATSPVRRRLELAVLVERLIDRMPGIAPRAAVHDLADSLADLLDEMQGEGVPPERIAALDVGGHAAHWQRTRDFLAIVAPLFAAEALPDPEARQRRAVQALAAAWAADPPADPVIVAGSTGSRGPTQLLMAAVAALPQGTVVLPGFDFDMPPGVWDGIGEALTAEDHPQFRFRAFCDRVGMAPADIRPLPGAEAPDPARNRLISLALRPAPVTDRWIEEGAGLPDLVAATAGMTLIEAPDPRAEAEAVALILRQAAEPGGPVAALVTPDRGLARRVAAALGRWGLVADDSAGQPLALSAPGRFLRQVATLAVARPRGEDLLALLKHPLAASGGERGRHLLLTRALELRLRRHGPVWPGPEDIRAFARRSTADVPQAAAWGDWLGDWLGDCLAGWLPAPGAGALPLPQAVSGLVARAEGLAAGPWAEAEGAGQLWAGQAGAQARAAMDELAAAAEAGGPVTPADLCRLLDRLMHGRAVRDPVVPHPRLHIWGPREARAQGAGLVILGGLNEGVWPAAAAADPWLNRAMRAEAGLRLPEREIGLAAHDWQQAAGAPRVVLTRARRDAEAETVPSRWLNRLTNLMAGLPDRQGPAALAAMRDRGAAWLALAEAAGAPGSTPRAPRPAPAPPVAARPRELPVTAVRTLIRDPYAVYARHILRLRPLDPLRAEPDAQLRGIALHRVFEVLARETAGPETAADLAARLRATARRVLAAEVPWPAARLLFAARIDRAAERVAGWLVELGGRPLVVEAPGAVHFDPPGVTLTARPDRIDLLPDGRAAIFDIKTGQVPTPDQQAHFDKQLALTAVLAEDGGFAAAGLAGGVARAAYLGIGSVPKLAEVAVDPQAIAAHRAGFVALMTAWMEPGRGYVSRRAMERAGDAGDYDHLARHGEWDITETAEVRPVGGDGA